MLRNMRDLMNGLVESLFVGLGRLGGSADFPHILQGSGLHFGIRGMRFKVVESPDVPAHKPMLTMGTTPWGGVPIDGFAERTIGFSYWIFRMSRRPGDAEELGSEQ
ncbi:hypothetical protein GCM10010523_22960 [Paenarthrobacter ilicis]